MPLLEIVQLVKSFRTPEGDTHCVVEIPAFSVAGMAEVAMSGESGSGKTTFLNLIAGILTPDSGRIQFDGQELTALKESARDRWRALNIGYIFQSFNLLQGFTCLENVLLAMSFGPGANRKTATQLLSRVGLEKRLNYYPRQLSVGQQQRVAVARALANHPKLVLADEPTGNLDSTNALQAVQLIREVCREQGASLLLVSHDPTILSQFPMTVPLSRANRAALQGVPS